MHFGKYTISRAHPPFIIAEMSGNHNHSLSRALAIVDAAARAGAHALKIQTYTPDTMTIDHAGDGFFIEDKDSPWCGQNLYQLYEQAHTPWDWHKAIFDRCHERGILGFSTPFDESSVDFLESLGVPFYKIASFENNDLPLIRKVASTKKPIIISTGMATISELDETVRTARGFGATDLVLLKCTSSYPASPEYSNVATLPHLQTLFGCEVGLSDHTLGVGAAVAAVALGASVIEKHFTLSRADGGVDSAFSMEPAEMASLVTETQRAWQSMGRVQYGPTPGEKSSMIFRRSIYVVKDISAGEFFSPENIRIIRPGFGLSPKHIDIFLGKRSSRNISRGTPLHWNMLGG